MFSVFNIQWVVLLSLCIKHCDFRCKFCIFTIECVRMKRQKTTKNDKKKYFCWDLHIWMWHTFGWDDDTLSSLLQHLYRQMQETRTCIIFSNILQSDNLHRISEFLWFSKRKKSFIFHQNDDFKSLYPSKHGFLFENIMLLYCVIPIDWKLHPYTPPPSNLHIFHSIEKFK